MCCVGDIFIVHYWCKASKMFGICENICTEKSWFVIAFPRKLDGIDDFVILLGNRRLNVVDEIH